MANLYKNKVVYGGNTLIDLSGDTVTSPAHIVSGRIGHLADGSQVTGTGGGSSAITVTDTLDAGGGTIREITAVDISGDTVDAAHLLSGYTAHDAAGNAVTGTYTAPTFSTQQKTATPSETAQTITPDSGYDGLSQVSIGAIDSDYVGSGIDQRDSTDLTASGATVTAPAGYYETAATKTIASGTAGTPTATKGTVSNHAVSITPSVTNTSGYITGSTKTGAAVSVSASELVSGNLAITENGPGIDVTNYATVSVDVASSGGIDIPVFTLIWDENYETVTSVTCNKTYAECASLYNDGDGRAVAVDCDSTGNPESSMSLGVYGVGGDNSITYNGFAAGRSIYDIIYYSNGTMEYVYPSSAARTLNVTSNGTYRPSWGAYTEVTVNVPSSGGASTVATASTTPSSNSTSIQFTVDGEPIMFAVQWSYTSGSYMSGSSTRYITSVICDGTHAYGSSVYRSGSTGREYFYSTVSFSYSNGTLTVTSPGSSTLGYFRSGYEYRLIYVY